VRYPSTKMSTLAGKTIALCVTGSIAAYKAVEVARLLVKRGATVLPVLTPSATKFVGAVTFSGITGQEARVDMWDASYAGEMHVHIADRADAIVIAPATADTLAKLAHGRADDLVSALALVARGPLVIAPAMHPRMWHHAATSANVEALARRGDVHFAGPVRGEVASGDVGVGRMSDPEAIVLELERTIAGRSAHAALARAPMRPRDLAGRHIVVTAGPTYEALDPVRFLGNRSSGTMGFAIAEACMERGARVTLICGPVSLTTPAGVVRVDITSAIELQAALDKVLGASLEGADALVMSAAVADYRPRDPKSDKMKKVGGGSLTLELIENPDVLATVGARRAGSLPVLVGFALETGSDAEILAYAKKKLAEKRVDLIVANPASEAIGTASNRATFVEPRAVEPQGTLEKAELAARLAAWIAKALAQGTRVTVPTIVS